METENELWTQLFQDKPISRVELENCQTQIMAQIVAKPVDFGEEIRLAERRKWGLGLATSLIVLGLSFGAFLWFESGLLDLGWKVLLVMLSELPFVSELRQVGQQILQGLMLLRELKTGLGLLWGVVSWPILGVLCVIVIFSSSDPVRHRKPSI